MDDIVKAALKKWPNVPACYGWLALDARGDWYMRDDACQHAGAFPHPKGSVIRHDKLREFIQRNYDRDDSGAWFFQNGPQRVYVELEAAPLILRVVPGAEVEDHTGARLAVQGCWLDEAGWLYLSTPRGLGLVHSQDMHAAAERIERGDWQPQAVARDELPRRFSFLRKPQGL